MNAAGYPTDRTAGTPPDLHPRGVNHLAISTTDMKVQLTFWSQVIGCPLKALYWMHGVPNAIHGFVELAPDSYVAFVQAPGNRADPEYGVTHAGNAGGKVTAGTMQHVALHVDSLDDLLAMRDRIRSHGVEVMGPIDHGMVASIYFAGPEGLSLEIASGTGIDAAQWIDPEVQQKCGISEDELAALLAPAGFDRPASAVPQPPGAGAPFRLHPEKMADHVMTMSDDETWERFSEPTPPVAPAD